MPFTMYHHGKAGTTHIFHTARPAAATGLLNLLVTLHGTHERSHFTSSETCEKSFEVTFPVHRLVT
jgi:hypothetical protein